MPIMPNIVHLSENLENTNGFYRFLVGLGVGGGDPYEHHLLSLGLFSSLTSGAVFLMVFGGN